MSAPRLEPDGRIVVEAAAYRLEVRADATHAILSSPAGAHLASLRLLAALDTVGAPDETLAAGPARLEDETIVIERRSTVWDRAAVVLVCSDETVEVRSTVEGRGTLADVHLLGGRSLLPDTSTGFAPSGSSFRTLFSPNPGDPARLVRSAGESAAIGVVGDGSLGRGHWFFTPAPLYLALTIDDVADPRDPAPAGWVGLSLVAPVEELNFLQLSYVPADRGFSLLLDYEGHTHVDGAFATPVVLLAPGAEDPFAGLRGHRHELTVRGAAPAPAAREEPVWWREPMFCGWGAQVHLARTSGRPAPSFATQESYNAFLAALKSHDVVPSTVVIDDKWQTTYGGCEPDTAKWPDLREWIGDRRTRGQHVLLWWKAWDPEGLPEELCVCTPERVPIALDPTNPAARDELRRIVRTMLSAEGLDADGLKIDLTARTPSGVALTHHGDAWGIALLHELLEVVYLAAKEAKQDALVITHTPHPAFVDVTDMLRLNDMLRLDDPGPFPPVVPQMRFRADVVRAACPELPIDTDDWCVPDKATWRAYLEEKPELGVASLYYATHIDLSGETLEADDYAAIRRSWARGSPRA